MYSDSSSLSEYFVVSLSSCLFLLPVYMRGGGDSVAPKGAESCSLSPVSCLL